MTQRLLRMVWIDTESNKMRGVFRWAREDFEKAREQYPNLHPHELTISTDSPYDPMIEVLTLTRNARLGRDQSILISDTITTWLKANHYILPNSAIDVWQIVYRKH